MNPWVQTLLVRATPGVTMALRNYFLGLTRVPIVPYMAISWPMSMAYAAVLILLGDAAFGGFSGGAWAWGVRFALLLALYGMVFGLRRWAGKHRRR